MKRILRLLGVDTPSDGGYQVTNRFGIYYFDTAWDAIKFAFLYR